MKEKSVEELLALMGREPTRFRDSGGYDHLMGALEEGRGVELVRRALVQGSVTVGDLLWTICELEVVATFAEAATRYVSSEDKGTSACAMEVVLRGSTKPSDIQVALAELEVCDGAICQHAVRTLWGTGLGRIIEVVEASRYPWTPNLLTAIRGRRVRGRKSRASSTRTIEFNRFSEPRSQRWLGRWNEMP